MHMGVFKSLLMTVATVPAFYILAILFGAPLLSHFEDTFVFAAVLSLFTTLPLALSCGNDVESAADLIFDAM